MSNYFLPRRSLGAFSPPLLLNKVSTLTDPHTWVVPRRLLGANVGPIEIGRETFLSYSLDDTFTISSTSVYDFIATGLSTIGITSSVDDIVSIILEISDSLDLDSSSFSTLIADLTDTLALSSDGAQNLSNLLSVSSALSITSAAVPVSTYIEAILTALVISDSVNRNHVGTGSSTISVSETIVDLLVRYAALEDAITISSAGVGDRITFAVSSTTVDISDSLDDVLTLIATGSSDVSLSAALNIDDTEYLAVVTNVATRGISEYNNYPFNSFGTINNIYIAAASDGIYTLDADDDEGTSIISYVETGLWDFGTSYKKIIPECYIGYTAAGELVIKMFTVEQGEKNERWYQLLRTKDTEDTDRFNLPKGVKSRYYQFELVNKEGDDFSLETIELFPAVLTRRLY